MFSLFRLLPVLLLTGCAQVPQLLERETPAPVNEHSPGVSITQDKPPRLAALTYYTGTAYHRERASACAEKLIQPDTAGEPVIRFTGRDMLNAAGMVSNTTRLYGMLPVRDRIRFELTLLEKVSGTTYGFRRIELSRFDRLGLNSHGFSALPPSGSKTQQVYQRLQQLYREMDHCIQGETAP